MPGVWGCGRGVEDRVVVFAASDRESIGPILDAFSREQPEGFELVAEYSSRGDAVWGRLTGRAGGDFVENGPGSADLFWDDSLLTTLKLREQGLLRRHRFEVPAGWPTELIATDRTWCGFAARARVLLLHSPTIESDPKSPRSVADLADPTWKGRCGMARPLSGASATHWAAMRSLFGDERTLVLMTGVRENAVLFDDEASMAREVSAGRLAWAVTDSDVAIGEKDLDYPVEIVFPDQAPDEPGTLRIPNSVAILRDAAHPVAAGRLADFLVTREIEDRLAMGPASQIPIHRDAKFPPAVLPSEPVRWMRVDWEMVIPGWEEWEHRMRAALAGEPPVPLGDPGSR